MLDRDTAHAFVDSREFDWTCESDAGEAHRLVDLILGEDDAEFVQPAERDEGRGLR